MLRWKDFFMLNINSAFRQNSEYVYTATICSEPCQLSCSSLFWCLAFLTLANGPSWSVFTPKRGMAAQLKLELCISFFTPLICDIGRFFFSLSFSLGTEVGISTSCCLSGGDRKYNSNGTSPVTKIPKILQKLMGIPIEIMNDNREDPLKKQIPCNERNKV